MSIKKKKNIFSSIFFLFLPFWGELNLIDFNKNTLKTSLKTDVQTCNYIPGNKNTYCKIKTVPDKEFNRKGYYLQVDYDVSTKQKARVGVVIDLKNKDLSAYKALGLSVQGDLEKKYPQQVKIEFRSGNRYAYFSLTNIQYYWNPFIIPFSNFRKSTPDFQWKNMTELALIFDNKELDIKIGRIYLDDISLFKTLKKAKKELEKGEIRRTKTQIKYLEDFTYKETKKYKLPWEDKKFLHSIATDTWKYFKYIKDKQTGMILDNITVSRNIRNVFIGDYTNITNIGLQILAILSAYDLKLIKEKQAISELEKLLATLQSLKKWNGLYYNYYKTYNKKIANQFISTVDNGWLACGLICLKQSFNGRFKEQTTSMLKKMDFSKLYDKKVGQLYLGYNTDSNKYTKGHYGLICSESRISSLVGIGKGDLPESHWFKINRTLPHKVKWQRQVPKGKWKTYLRVKMFQGYYTYKGQKFVPSWGGSMFEYFMPGMLINEQKWANKNLGKNNKKIFDLQIQYSKDKNYKFWGFSPCSTPDKSHGGYFEFGVTELGSKGYKDGSAVVTPHAVILPMLYDPKACIANLRNLIKHFPALYGEYGLYDAVNIKKSLVAKKYLALDQAMILITLNNYLNDRAIQKRFEKDNIFTILKTLLSRETFL